MAATHLLCKLRDFSILPSRRTSRPAHVPYRCVLMVSLGSFTYLVSQDHERSRYIFCERLHVVKILARHGYPFVVGAGLVEPFIARSAL